MAAEFIPVAGVDVRELAEAAQFASLADETPEGRSIVVLAKREFNLRARELGEDGATFIPFSAQTRMSGVDIGGRRIRKGAAEQVVHFVKENHGTPLTDLQAIVERIARSGCCSYTQTNVNSRIGCGPLDSRRLRVMPNLAACSKRRAPKF